MDSPLFEASQKQAEGNPRSGDIVAYDLESLAMPLEYADKNLPSFWWDLCGK
jgi:hypothetical protein